MGAKGEKTRERIMDATLALIAGDGYGQTTIRAIAAEAGIAEGTIYRHFPDKTSILVAALTRHQEPVDEWLDELPARAGEGTVAGNLVSCLLRLAQLRDQVLPLEVAMLTDPDLRAARREVLSSAEVPTPVRQIAAYFEAERDRGRIRPEVEPLEAAVVVLAVLLGLSVADLGTAGPPLEAIVGRGVEILVTGLGSP